MIVRRLIVLGAALTALPTMAACGKDSGSKSADAARSDVQRIVDLVTKDVAEVERNWERLKAAEKGRSSVMDGIPLAQPALALAEKAQSRAQRGGVGPIPRPADLPAEIEIGDALFALVALSRERGVDPEEALRATSRRFVAAVREAERAILAKPGEVTSDPPADPVTR